MLITKTFDARPPAEFLQWEFLADATKLYTRPRFAQPLATLFQHPSTLETALSPLKKTLISKLDAGLKSDLGALEHTLARLNHLIHASPDAAAFFLAGSDYLDGLISCYKIMNPPLRKVIIATTFLCLTGLFEAQTDADSTEGKGKAASGGPKWGMLSDTLYSLHAAAEAHRTGPTNANDSLVAELVSATPILSLVLRRAEDSSALTPTLKARVDLLQGFKKMGVGAVRPKAKRRRQPKPNKGKGRDDGEEVRASMHIHQMSQISIIQELFPDLGSGFVAKLLDEFGDDVETVTARLLEDSLPPHLAGADRSEQLFVCPPTCNTSLADLTTRTAHSPVAERPHYEMAPRSTPPPPEPSLPQRRNVFDDDELTETMSNLHFGKRNPGKTADALLADRSAAPGKAAIMSALAAFDSDDDERDDTYDADDVGGAVDAVAGGDEEADGGANEETLFRAWQADPSVFERDAAARKGAPRAKLKQETGMTDEALEGWAIMLLRSPKLKRRLEAKFSGFHGQQTELASTSWRANGEDDDGEAGGSSNRGGRGRGRGRGRGGGGGGGRGGGNVAGPTGEKETEAARRRKEASKGSRANHNRRDQRAKKMARGGFPG